MKARASLGSLIFLVLAPGGVAGYLPWLISRWRGAPAPVLPEPAHWLGLVLILLGLAVVIEAFARFALRGLGTPAPVYPTRSLVVGGAYRHARNPMYCAVVAVILGQAVVFENPWVAAYGAAVWLASHLFVLASEEPTLLAAYGEAYEAFRRAVPRWIPRLRPWDGAAA